MRTVKWVMLVVLVGAIGCGDNPVEADANYRLGEQYLSGDGVAKDEKEALKWYRMAAEQGSARAQFMLGFMYVKGGSVPKDDVNAAKWRRNAQEQGCSVVEKHVLEEIIEQGRGR